MSNFVINVVSWILLLLVILTLYLIDKVNHLTSLQEMPDAEQPMQDMEAGDILFAGLESKRLWDAMNGREVPGFDLKLVDALRGHYAQILHDHIVLTFDDGLGHARQKFEMNSPAADRAIPTPRGHVSSWLPSQHLGSLYRAAYELGEMPYDAYEDEQIDRLRKTFDSVASMLHQRTGVPLGRPYSQDLFEKAKSTSASMPEIMAQPQDEAVVEVEQTPMQTLPNGPIASEQSPKGSVTVADDQGQTMMSPESVNAYEQQQRQDLAVEQEAKAMTAVVLEPTPQQVAV